MKTNEILERDVTEGWQSFGTLALVTRQERSLSDLEDLDRQSIEAFRGGQREAFDHLVRAHRSRVFGICYRYTGNRADADDVSQEVFLRAYKGLPRFRGEARFSTWLYRIAVNACLNWVAGRKRDTSELSEDLVDPGPSPQERASQSELSTTLRAAVRRLPDRQRMTVVLRVYEGLSHKEIGAVMGCPVGTAKANLFFALKNLRKLLPGENSVPDQDMG